jgi:cold shock protein
MSESVAKKEKEKQKAKNKRDKAEKMQARKSNNNKGKSLSDMMAYVDENGDLTSRPPDGRAKKEINLEDIQLGAQVSAPEDLNKIGVVSIFNDAKGYGFIVEEKTRENIFVHANSLLQPIKERDRVTFQKERTPKGYAATNVKKID